MGISTVQTSSPTHFVKVVEPSAVTQQFALNHEKFAHLASPSEFEQLKSHLIEVDIHSELSTLTSDGFLEVTVPVLGLTDFLASDPTWHEFSQQFPVPIAVNQYGAPSDSTAGESYHPQADFIVVRDILGNQFELVVNADGMIDIPERGDGLFSIITEITYIYSYEQVISGDSLFNLAGAGAEAGKLYLLPPPGAHDGFNIKVASAHLDATNEKVIDQILKIPVVQLNDDLKELTAINTSVNNLTDDQNNLYQLEISYRKKNYNGESFGIDVALQKIPGVTYELDTHDGWSVNSDNSNIFTKQIGLSDYALSALVRNVFSEFDFSKALLSGESFNISQNSGFNNFMLSPEAVGLYYDLFVSGVVNHTLPGEWLLAHVPNERFENLNLDYAFLSDHDAELVTHISHDVKEGHFDSFAEHFYDPHLPSETMVNETIYVKASNVTPGFVPEVEGNLHLLADHGFRGLMDSLPTLIDAALWHTGSALSSEIALSPGHEAMTIHYGDIMQTGASHGATIIGFDLNHDKLNLGDLLENNPEFSKEAVRTDINGSDVHVVMTNATTGEELTLATLVGAHQPTQDPNLPTPGNFIEFDT